MGLLGFLGGKKGGGTPKYAQKALLGMLDEAKKTAAIPFTPYEETRVAPVNSTITGGISTINSAPAAGASAINAAIDLAKQKASYSPLQITAPTMTAATMNASSIAPVQGIFGATVAPVADVSGVDRSLVGQVGADTFLDYDMGAYMNPYLQNVVGSVMDNLAFQREQQRGVDNARAVQAGAFGGSRQAVVDAQTNDMFNRTLGTTVSDLYNRGYDTASGLIMQDANRKLSADQTNQGADVSLLGMDQEAKARNQAAAQAAALAEAGYSQDAAKTNQSVLFNTGARNAEMEQAAAAANMAAANAASQGNAASGLEALKVNQAAGLTANQQGVTAAGLLGDFGADQSRIKLDAGTAAVQAGSLTQSIQQKMEDEKYLEFLRKIGHPAAQLGILQSATGQLVQTETRPTQGLFEVEAMRLKNDGMAMDNAGKFMGMLGGCWVAREVYGADNPEWLRVRAWLFSTAPAWFRDLYLRHGERFAAWIADKPVLKFLIRQLMNRVGH
ncbi:hypothetical protein [Emcibacter sp. SYSU 3D8]|uniref:hypothetical protein n=1 Tax=Emcibacter sp. SYSU 3D8 TaxID=3133969 RepID=UPI0031FEE4DD